MATVEERGGPSLPTTNTPHSLPLSLPSLPFPPLKLLSAYFLYRQIISIFSLSKGSIYFPSLRPNEPLQPNLNYWVTRGLLGVAMAL